MVKNFTITCHGSKTIGNITIYNEITNPSNEPFALPAIECKMLVQGEGYMSSGLTSRNIKTGYNKQILENDRDSTNFQ